jgi:NAD(P)-dependent dehydrogenase (short-subunit alcohol dehydrogenase family)
VEINPRLKDRVFIVTGSSSGIGRAIALLFAEHGARLGLMDVQEPSRLDTEQPSTYELLKSLGASYQFFQIDVQNDTAVQHAIAQVVQQFDRIDGLVNSAGIFIRNPIWAVSADEWDHVLNVNLKGAYLTMKYTLPIMIAQKHGKIVNVSSIHGLVGPTDGATYAASKAALVNLTKQVAVDVARYGINVNAICPGTIETAMSKPFRENPDLMAEYLHRTLLPRLGKPLDVAYAALYLASSEADFVTGHALVIDGGWTAW